MSNNVETIGLGDLKPDPQNARKHTPRNVGMIADALQEVGAARSIVIDEKGVVLAGNATIKAAGRAGLARVKVVDADGSEIIAVRRTGLTPRQKKRLALYDNRAAELAEWDSDVLSDLPTACWRPTPSCAVKWFPLRQSVPPRPPATTLRRRARRRA